LVCHPGATLRRAEISSNEFRPQKEIVEILDVYNKNGNFK